MRYIETEYNSHVTATMFIDLQGERDTDTIEAFAHDFLGDLIGGVSPWTIALTTLNVVLDLARVEVEAA